MNYAKSGNTVCDQIRNMFNLKKPDLNKSMVEIPEINYFNEQKSDDDDPIKLLSDADETNDNEKEWTSLLIAKRFVECFKSVQMNTKQWRFTFKTIKNQLLCHCLNLKDQQEEFYLHYTAIDGNDANGYTKLNLADYEKQEQKEFIERNKEVWKSMFNEGKDYQLSNLTILIIYFF